MSLLGRAGFGLNIAQLIVKIGRRVADVNGFALCAFALKLSNILLLL